MLFWIGCQQHLLHMQRKLFRINICQQGWHVRRIRRNMRGSERPRFEQDQFRGWREAKGHKRLVYQYKIHIISFKSNRRLLDSIALLNIKRNAKLASATAHYVYASTSAT